MEGVIEGVMERVIEGGELCDGGSGGRHGGCEGCDGY